MLEDTEETSQVSVAAGEAGAADGSDVPSTPSCQEEAPYPNRAAPEGGTNSICCEVCRAEIPMRKEFLRSYIVKCEKCQEYIPLRHPPPGKRFLRCVCKKLLCFSNSKVYVTCSRTLCNRVIKVPVLSKPVVIYRKVQIICVHCNETFLWPAGKSSLSRCPHCLKISSFGRSYARKRIAFFCVMTVCFAIATGVVIGLTVTRNLLMGLYAIWTFLFLVCLFYAYKTGFWISVKVSRPVENTTSEGQTSSPHPRPTEYGPGPDSFITTYI